MTVVSKFIKERIKTRLFVLAVALAAALVGTHSAIAQNTWTGLVGNNWDNGSNWSPQFVLPTSNNTTALTFGAATNYVSNQNLASPFTLNSMTFTPAATSAYTIQGNAINFVQNATFPGIIQDSPQNVTVNNALTLSSNTFLVTDGAGILTLNGVISGGSTLNKADPGTAVLGGVNTFTNNVNVTGGVLSITNAGAIPSGRSVTVSAGAVFRLANSSGDNLATPMGTLTLNGGTLQIPAGAADYHINHLSVSNGGTVDFTGSTNFWVHLIGTGAGIDFTGNSTWTGGGTSRIQNDTAGTIDFNIGSGSTLTSSVRLAAGTQAQGFHVNGGGALVQTAGGSSAPLSIDGFSTYRFADPNFVTTGGVTLEAASVLNYTGSAAGNLNRFFTLGSGGGQIVPTGGGAITLSGVISETGGSQPLFAVSGTVIPTAANTFTGKSDVYAGGVLSIPSIANGGIASPLGASTSAPANLVIEDGTLRYTGATATTDRGMTFTNSASKIEVIAAATSLTIGGQITGSGALNKIGPGTLVLGNATNNYINTFVNAGTLQLTGSSNEIPIGGNVTVASGATFAIGSGSNGVRSIGTITLNGGTMSVAPYTSNSGYIATNLVMTGGTLNIPQDPSAIATYDFNLLSSITINASSTTSTWNGDTAPGAAIQASNIGSLIINVAKGTTPNGIDLDSSLSLHGSFTKMGLGVMRMSQQGYTNTNLTVAQGTFRFDDVSVFNNFTSIPVFNSTMTLAGGTLQYGGATSASADANPLALGAGGGTIETPNAGVTLTLPGVISGSTGLTKIGAGTLTLANSANTYTGPTTISAGVLSVGTLTKGSNNSPIGASANSASNLNIGPGTFRYTGSNVTTDRGFTITDAASKVEVSTAATNLNFTGQITGAGTLNKTGPGTLTLGNTANTYTGPTVISGGVLSVPLILGGGANSSIGKSSNASSNLVLAGGTLHFTGSALSSDRGFTVSAPSTFDAAGSLFVSFSGPVVGSGKLTKIGSQDLGLFANSPNFSGGTDVEAGDLQVGNLGTTGDLGTGNVNIGASGTVTFLRSDNAITIPNIFSGAGTLAFGGPNTVNQGGFQLTQNNSSFSGGIVLLASRNSRLSATSPNQLGTATVTVNSGSSLFLQTGGTFANALTLNGNGWTETAGQLGALRLDGNVTASGPITLAANSRLTTTDTAIGGTETISGVISGNFGVEKTGGGTLVLSAANTYTGATTISAGILSVGTLANGGANSNIGASSNASSNLVLAGGTLRYTGGTIQTDRGLTVSAPSTIDVSGSGSARFAGAIVGGAKIIKIGPMFLTLLGNNSSFSGGFDVQGGKLQAGLGGTSGDLGTGNVNIAPGAFVFFSRSDSALSIPNNFSGAGALQFSGNDTIDQGGYQLTGNNSNYSGPILLGNSLLDCRLTTINSNQLGTATVTVQPGSSLFLSGGGTYANALTLSGNGWTEDAGQLGALRLFGGATVSGPVTLAADTRLTVFESSSGTISGAISGNFGLEKTGIGTLVLSNSANSYTGTTTVSAGTLKLGTASANQIPSGGSVTVASGATFDLGSPAGFGNSSRPAGTITLNGGTMKAGPLSAFGTYDASALVMNGGTVDFSPTTGQQFDFRLQTSVTINASMTTAFWKGDTAGDTSLTNASSGPLTITVAKGTTPSGIDLDSSLSLGTAAADHQFIKAGPGVMRMTQQSFAGSKLTVAQGTFRLDDVSIFNKLTSPTLQNVLTLAGGTFQFGGTTSATADANPLTLGTGGGTIDLPTAGVALTLPGIVGGTNGLTKSGPGTLTLSGVNTYTGVTTISSGVLSVATMADGGAASGIGSSSNQSSNLVLVGGTLQYTGGAAVTTNRGLTVSAPSTIDIAGQGLTFSGPIVGSAKLTKTGVQTLQFTANNPGFSGGIDVQRLFVEAGSGGSTGDLGTGTVNIASGASVDWFRSNNAVTISNVFTGAGGLDFSGTGVSNQSGYLLTGNNSNYSGSIALGSQAPPDAVRLEVTNPNQVGSGLIVVQPTSSLFLSGGATYANTLRIRGNGWVETAGQLGALRLDNGVTVSGPVTLFANSRVTTFLAQDTGTISSVISGAFALEKTGDGTLIINGSADNTFTGDTHVSAGTLALGKTGGITAVPGTLTIDGPGTVQLLTSNQIADFSTVTLRTIAGTATFDTNGQTETVAQLSGVGTISGGGTLTTTNGVVSPNAVGTGGVTVSAGTTLATAFVQQDAVTVNGILRIKPRSAGGNTSVVHTLMIVSATGKVDLADNQMIVDYATGGPSPLATIANQLKIARAGGAWTGNGITSSLANASTFGIGYGEASTVLGLTGSQTATFGGQPADATSVLLRYTIYGDANLDGTVGFSDLVALAQHYGISDGSANWTTGDFNYDGNVDFADLVTLAQHYGSTLPSAAIPGAPADFANDMAQAFSSVPEPGSLSVVNLAGLALLRRRRRD